MLIKDECAVSEIANVPSDRVRIGGPLSKTKIGNSRACGLCDIAMLGVTHETHGHYY